MSETPWTPLSSPFWAAFLCPHPDVARLGIEHDPRRHLIWNQNAGSLARQLGLGTVCSLKCFVYTQNGSLLNKHLPWADPVQSSAPPWRHLQFPFQSNPFFVPVFFPCVAYSSLSFQNRPFSPLSSFLKAGRVHSIDYGNNSNHRTGGWKGPWRSHRWVPLR